MATLEEKQAELDNLQLAFDEYIASSRELEEELDAELAKMQTEVDRTERRNAALNEQLTSVTPQLTSLETKLASVSSRLNRETQLRVEAERSAEESSHRLREAEASLESVRATEVRRWKEECEEACEALAFSQGEAEDNRREWDEERERRRMEAEEARGEVDALRMKLGKSEERRLGLEERMPAEGGRSVESENGEGEHDALTNGAAMNGTNGISQGEGESDVPPQQSPPQTSQENSNDASSDSNDNASTTSRNSAAFDTDREEYVRTLEDELELVTEQLIDAERKLSRTEAELEESRANATSWANAAGAAARAAVVENSGGDEGEGGGGDGNAGVANLDRAMAAAATTNGGPTANEDADETKAVVLTATDANHEQITTLETELITLRSTHTDLLADHKRTREELELALEELTLGREELEASEEDSQTHRAELDDERRKRREEAARLTSAAERSAGEARAKELELETWKESLMTVETEKGTLKETMERLEEALRNAKADGASTQEELDELRSAFDERTVSEGVANEELLATRTREVDELREEVRNLNDTNSSLAKMLGDTEEELKRQREDREEKEKEFEAEEQAKVEKDAALATCAEKSTREMEEARDEIYSLEGLLEEARGEVGRMQTALGEKVARAEKELEVAERELGATREKLADADKMKHVTPVPPPSKSTVTSSSTSSSDAKTARRLFSADGNDSFVADFDDDDDRDDVSSRSVFHRTHALSRRLASQSRGRDRVRSCSPTTVQRLETRAKHRCAAARGLRERYTRLEEQNRMSASMNGHLEEEVQGLRTKVRTLEASGGGGNGNASRRSSGIPRPTSPSSDNVTTMEDDSDPDASTAVSTLAVQNLLSSNDPTTAIANEFRTLSTRIASAKSHNAVLLTRILKLQGNIQVCCRIRPMREDESRRGLHEVAQGLSETELGCFDERTKSWKSYAFDKVWASDTTQRDVFRDVEPLALSVIDGYNTCIFAYGQTGSGKTYTMEGTTENHNTYTGNSQQHGISQRTIRKIFGMLDDRKRQQAEAANAARRTITDENDPSGGDVEEEEEQDKFEFSIEVGMLEIYNDEVYDLLSPNITNTAHRDSPKKKSLEIRRDADNVVDVPDLAKERVTSVAEVLDALRRGNSNRATTSTSLNEHSSRSHMVLHVEVTSGVGESRTKGSLYLVDLAGSERVRKSEVEGKALKEAQHINKSLSALGNVMEALDRKATHIPYRDSKLTYLLQNSLGGNSRTMMVVTVCPHNNSYDETTFALKFATRVRRINLGSAHKNIMAKNLEETVKQLTEEKSLLSRAKERSESQLSSLKREKDRVEDRLAKVSAARSNSKDEMRTLSVLRQSNHDTTARWQKEKSIREEKTLELERTQEELRKLQKSLASVTREQQYVSKQLQDKEGVIFDLNKTLRTARENLSAEKIRNRRTQVMQSRIPGPSSQIRPPTVRTTTEPRQQPTATATAKRANTGAAKVGARAATAPKPSTTALPALATASVKATDSTTNSTTAKRPATTGVINENMANVRSHVLRILQDHDPTKVDKIDAVMSKFEGREEELLEKMVSRYEGDKGSVTGSVESEFTTGTTTTAHNNNSGGGNSTTLDDQKKSRADMALERHMARMKKKKAERERAR